MDISLVVAVAKNGVIGRAGGLPWRLSTDLKRFKALTIGKPIVMGRKCYDSIGKPLPGRANIVLTRHTDFAPEGILVAHRFDQAMEMARTEAARMGADEIAVIGGGVIYDLAMPQATILYVTHIDHDIEGDTWFGPIDPDDWEIAHHEDVPDGEKDEFATRFVTYRRRGR